MQYSTLIAQIEADIYSNGAELITGDILQTVLKRMVSAWASAGAAYGGTISPDTVVPLNLDQATVYLALTAGTYEHFLDGEGDPIETTGPALVIYDGGPALIFSKTDLPSGGSGATVITTDGSDGDSVAIRLTDSQTYKRVFRIDVAGTYTGGDVIQRIGSLIIECFDEDNNICHGYYYGDAMADILTDVAVYQDDTDSDTFYLMLTHESSLDSVTFAITPLDGGEVDAFTTNAGDDHTKVADATITPVGGSSDVFWATYNSTTLQEIGDAYNAGKLVVCMKGGTDYILSSYVANGFAYFGNVANKTSRYLLRSTSGWSEGIRTLEDTSDKVSTLSGNETNTTKYPNTKAVADALGKMGVISQTQTWSGTGSNPRTYTIDPASIVRGLIPQANIDLFEAAGAVFNATTGYFELNGLTDISYEEMREVYYKTIAAKEIPDKSFMFAYDSSLRTNLPTSNVNRVSASYLSASNRVNLFYACIGAGIEVFAVLPVTATQKAIMSDMRASFSNAYNLKRIQGIWDFTNVSTAGNLFNNCYSLESVSIYHLKIALSLANSSLLDKASLLYMINNEASTSAITITLHASVYAKCQSGGEWYSDISTALAAHTNVSLASA